MNFDLNSFYSRYDNAGASVSYYGYINTNSSGTNFTNIADTAPAFSIRKTYYVGNVQYTDWSNNTMQAYESVWNDRTYCFATPSMTSVTASTYSDGYHTNMSISWTSVQGASRFQIKLSLDINIIFGLIKCRIMEASIKKKETKTIQTLKSILGADLPETIQKY